MKVFLDDERPAPGADWHKVETAEEAIELLASGKVTQISLDHDLGIGCSTGYDVACYIERAAFEGTLKPIRISVHSQNPVGKNNIKAACKKALDFWRSQENSNDHRGI